MGKLFRFLIVIRRRLLRGGGIYILETGYRTTSKTCSMQKVEGGGLIVKANRYYTEKQGRYLGAKLAVAVNRR